MATVSPRVKARREGPAPLKQIRQKVADASSSGLRQSRHQVRAEGLVPVIVKKAAMQFRLAGKHLRRQYGGTLQIVHSVGARIAGGQNFACFFRGHGVIRHNQSQSQRRWYRGRNSSERGFRFPRPQ